MSEKSIFNNLVQQAVSVSGQEHMRPVIEKELLHYDILFALDKCGLLDELTFQGGTLLRLCYGSPRFSEDLDFCGGVDFSSKKLLEMKLIIEDFLGKKYGLEVIVKEPKPISVVENENQVIVSKWQIAITTSPERKDLPKQKIKLEVINIPAYSREPLLLQKNYPFLPDGYDDLLVMSESLDEVMADKIISYVNCHKYIRYRDLWDLSWLIKQGATVNDQYILNKINDYQISNYPEKLRESLGNMSEVIHSENFKAQMTRFIPMAAQERTIRKDKFFIFLNREMLALFGGVLTLFV